eukprot:364904-Chlamydomonas_euryale.AAC.13
MCGHRPLRGTLTWRTEPHCPGVNTRRTSSCAMKGTAGPDMPVKNDKSAPAPPFPHPQQARASVHPQGHPTPAEAATPAAPPRLDAPGRVAVVAAAAHAVRLPAPGSARSAGGSPVGQQACKR